ncbi:MAG: VWA domain-containing protein [Candidatus Sericytochromatia bacterium]|nr:VWA domain-containing protein [Candidatus Tanganyikabacteria bacterium]
MSGVGGLKASLLLTLGVASAVVGGCSKQQPVAAIALLDCSESSWPHRQGSIAALRTIAHALDPVLDRLAIYRMTDTIFPIYPRREPSGRELAAVLAAYSDGERWDERGTAYGDGLDRVLRDARDAQRGGYRTAILVFGDGADEPIARPHANFDPIDPVRWTDPLRALASSSVLAFMFTEPRRTDHFRPLLDGLDRDRVFALSPVAMSSPKGLTAIIRTLGR